MNKTVTINLAGIFFHIDEDAYLKLQRYLQAIKRSFTDSQGRDEIIADIEARIAEIFGEKIKDERQVIDSKQVDDVIAVMGQPEDYRLDEEIFEDEPSTAHNQSYTSKQLFRDTTNSYVGGVSSGLGHYIGMDPTWLRLSWILLTLFSGGGFILIYIAFWIFVPEAKTTADFLAMKGEAVNINTIEKKIKEGFNDVAEKVKDVDYQRYTDKVKSGSTNFFETLINIFLAILKVFVKFIGGILVLTSGITIISLFIGLIVVGIFGFTNTEFIEHFDVFNHPNVPLWLASLLVFFAIAIPFFFLFILGLKIVINNLKSIGTPTKLGLLAVWVIAIIGLIILGIQQATMDAYDAEIIENARILDVTPTDTLTIKMLGNNRYVKYLDHRNDFSIKRDENDNKVLVIQDILIYLKENKKDQTTRLTIRKTAEGSSYNNAKEKATDIKYGYEINGHTLFLDGYAITDYKNKYHDQEVEIILTIPEGLTILADDNTSGYNNSWRYDDYISLHDKEGRYVQLIDGSLTCKDCPKDSWEYNEWEEEENESNDGVNININDDDTKLKIDEDGIQIKSEDVDIKIDENGLKIKTDTSN